MAQQRLNVKKLIASRFAGRTQLQRLLAKRGHDIGKASIDKWVERGRIPGDWWPELYKICDEQGRPLDLAPYMEGAQDAEESIF